MHVIHTYPSTAGRLPAGVKAKDWMIVSRWAAAVLLSALAIFQTPEHLSWFVIDDLLEARSTAGGQL